MSGTSKTEEKVKEILKNDMNIEGGPTDRDIGQSGQFANFESDLKRAQAGDFARDKKLTSATGQVDRNLADGTGSDENDPKKLGDIRRATDAQKANAAAMLAEASWRGKKDSQVKQ